MINDNSSIYKSKVWNGYQQYLHNWTRTIWAESYSDWEFVGFYTSATAFKLSKIL